MAQGLCMVLREVQVSHMHMTSFMWHWHGKEKGLSRIFVFLSFHNQSDRLSLFSFALSAPTQVATPMVCVQVL